MLTGSFSVLILASVVFYASKILIVDHFSFLWLRSDHTALILFLYVWQFLLYIQFNLSVSVSLLEYGTTKDFFLCPFLFLQILSLLIISATAMAVQKQIYIYNKKKVNYTTLLRIFNTLNLLCLKLNALSFFLNCASPRVFVISMNYTIIILQARMIRTIFDSSFSLLSSSL